MRYAIYPEMINKLLRGNCPKQYLFIRPDASFVCTRRNNSQELLSDEKQYIKR